MNQILCNRVVSTLPSKRINMNRKEIALKTKMAHALRFFNERPEKIIGKSRKREHVVARQIISLYLNSRGHTLTGVGEIFGGRDHTTILYSVRTIENLIEKYQEYAEKYKRFEEWMEKIN